MKEGIDCVICTLMILPISFNFGSFAQGPIGTYASLAQHGRQIYRVSCLPNSLGDIFKASINHPLSM
jgi:hypothetical protein